MSNYILVLGANGKTGKRVAGRLLEMNLTVRMGSRNANPKFDWEDPATWSSVLKDVTKVYITYQPDLAVPGAVGVIQSFVTKAVHAGVQKIVLLSGRGEKEARQCEEIVMSSGADWTIVRASWFSQNFSESFFLDSILAGHVALPTRGVTEPFVDVEDIADVVTAALTNNEHSRKLYELTGPRLLTFEQALKEISKAANLPVQYQEISIEAYTAMLREYNTPNEFIWLLEYLFTEVLDGRNENICDGVEQALGRKPIDFSDYAKRTAATGIWTSPEFMGVIDFKTS